MRELTEISNIEAKNYFLKTSSYTRLDFPKYIDFDSTLKEIDIEMTGRNYFKSVRNSLMREKEINYKILHTKNSNYDWREQTLVNPTVYVALVNIITEEKNWNEIIERLKRDSRVDCYSIPIYLDADKETIKMKQILSWWENIEQKSLEYSLDYSYIGVTDIVTCYDSIYTHSIAWALHGKELIKERRLNKKSKTKLFGEQLDDMFMDISKGQTNGIPQGNIISDLIAEIILKEIDVILSEKIELLNINDIKIIRYRDDYKILGKNYENVNLVLKELSEVLREFGMRINKEKTYISDDIIASAIKKDKIEWIKLKNEELTIQKKLILLYNFSKKYPNSGTLEKEFNELYNGLIEKKIKIRDQEALVLIGIVTNMICENSRLYSKGFSILSLLLKRFENPDEIIETLKKIQKKLEKISNTEYVEIWLQRISMKYIELEYKSELCKAIARKESNIWNNDWSNLKNCKDILNENKFIDQEKLEESEEWIDEEEFEGFSLSFRY
ncbi:RNA-directed DNA polymerase [Cetobacterium sp. 2A]|uniref:RNA-directed DNA polymerase n=1 Tax=Cetobacterium sp. 2A TaxID=2754723 RepID=UPI00163C07EA|nr:RNA-directed DNA polymerase [Cetobacterium sp. 2A]MBC2857035.1 RNA-directed DNA polymerase [Cetobacterium sp. 2A]